LMFPEQKDEEAALAEWPKKEKKADTVVEED